MARYRDSRKVIKIFFASPGDVGKERKSFRQIVQEANRRKANSMGVQLEALGWEDTLPGKGRPQDQINADLKSANLTVFVFWKRWGTPTGSFSSGTEEEFAVARQKSAADGSDLWLYFKKVPANERAVADDQFRKVLQFRAKIRDEREFLFCDCDNYRDWESRFSDHLYCWLDKNRLRQLIWRPPTQIRRPSLSERQEAISLLLAADADEDAQVELFRKTTLGDRLLRAAEIEPWIQQQASKDGPPTRWVRVPIPKENRLTAEPAGFSITPPLTLSGTERPIGFALESLDYGVPEDNWSRCIPVALGGTLGQLRLISEELANSYGWQKAQAVLFVLTRATPIVGF
jgi:hypothetical protein